MSKAWPRVSLSALLRLERRPVQLQPDEQYQEIGIYCFGRGIFHKAPRSGLEVGDKALFLLKEGDFILQVTFAWEGAVAVVSSTEQGMYGSTRYPTFRVDESRCIPRYLLNYFKTREGIQQLVNICPGSAGRNRVLSIKRIPEVVVPLPSLTEQRQVVARIEELAGQIQEARGLRQESETQTHALIESLHNHLAGERTRRLGDLITLDEDAVRVLPEGSYPQVGLRSFGAGLFKKAAVGGMDTTYKTFNRLYDGALVLSQVKGWEGALAVCSRDFANYYVSPEYRTFRCNPDEARPKYLASIVRLKWFWGRLGSATRGVGARRERTRPEQFLQLQLPMPSIQQQEIGEMVFEQLDALKAARTATAPELDALLPAILDRAFKGELV